MPEAAPQAQADSNSAGPAESDSEYYLKSTPPGPVLWPGAAGRPAGAGKPPAAGSRLRNLMMP
jgi:hypothetical protein